VRANVDCFRGAQISQNSRSYFKILSAKRVIWSQFHSEEPLILGPTVQNVIATTKGTPDLCNPRETGSAVLMWFPNCACILVVTEIYNGPNGCRGCCAEVYTTHTRVCLSVIGPSWSWRSVRSPKQTAEPWDRKRERWSKSHDHKYRPLQAKQELSVP
jgi:hypothetical protein